MSAGMEHVLVWPVVGNTEPPLWVCTKILSTDSRITLWVEANAQTASGSAVSHDERFLEQWFPSVEC